MRDAWGSLNGLPLVTRMLAPGLKVTIHQDTAEAFQALGRIVQLYNYKCRPAECGGYNKRPIKSGKGWSLHSWGIAIDINWLTNPWSTSNKLITDMPVAMVNAILRIKTKGGIPVFRWGGNFKSVKDAMHFEVNATPAELRKGIDHVTAPKISVDVEHPKHNPILQLWDQGAVVKELQILLIRLGHALKADGIFGPMVYGAVVAEQSKNGLMADGVVGPNTWEVLYPKPKLVPATAKPPVIATTSATPVAKLELSLPPEPVKESKKEAYTRALTAERQVLVAQELTDEEIATPKSRTEGATASNNKVGVLSKDQNTVLMRMPAKKLWLTKTFLVNAGAVLILVVNALIEYPALEQIAPMVAAALPIANIILRTLTNQPVTTNPSETTVEVSYAKPA